MPLFLLFLCLVMAAPVWALEPVRLQLRWRHQFQSAGYYAALHKGFYQEAGLDVTLKEGGPGSDVVEDVLSGVAEFGVGSSNLVLDYLNGKPVLMLGPIFQHSPTALAVYGSDRNLADLVKSGRVALMRGNQNAELKAMFVSEGIPPGKVQFEFQHQHLACFIKQDVDAINVYVGNEPFMLDELGIPYTLFKPSMYGMDFYGDLLFTRQAMEKQRPQTVAAFYAASLRGWKYAFEHPDEVIDLILKQYNTRLKSREALEFEARTLEELTNASIIDIGHNNPGRWKHIVGVYKKLGLVRNDKPLDGFFYRTDRQIDLSWFYWSFFIIAVVALSAAGIATYVYRINRRLAYSEEHHRIIFQTSASAGIVWSSGGVICDWNQMAETIFGWKREEVIGRKIQDLILPEHERSRLLVEVFKCPGEQDITPQIINDNCTRDGRIITCEWFNACLPEQPGKIRQAISLAIDISERKRLEEEIRQLAFYDPLTGLPNRRLLQDRIGRVQAGLMRSGGYGAIMFIDLDNFKPLNDLHGHAAGDILLVEVAKRLTAEVRKTDTVARLGGDEFVVLFCELARDYTMAKTHIQQLGKKILGHLAMSYYIKKSDDDPVVEHQCTASIGVVIFNGTASEVDILHQADLAMYEAKQAGRNRMCINEITIETSTACSY